MKQEDIIKKLSDRNLKEVADRAGVSYGTILRVSKGMDTKQSTLNKIGDYLAKN